MHDSLTTKTLAELTTQIVAAYVTHHSVAATDLPALIDAVAKRMAALTAAAEKKEAAKPEPAVPVQRSVTPEYLVCLVCGQRARTLRRHLRVAHGLTPAAYRETFGLRRDYPMTAPAYAARRSEIARRIGLGGARRTPEPPPTRRRTRSATAKAAAPAS